MHKLLEIIDATLPRPRPHMTYAEQYAQEFAADVVEVVVWHEDRQYGIQMMTNRYDDDRALEYQARAIVRAIEKQIANKEPSGPSCPIRAWDAHDIRKQVWWYPKPKDPHFDWSPYAHH